MTDSSSNAAHDKHKVVLDRMRDDWQGVAEAWEQWEPFFAAGGWPVTQKMIAGLRLVPGARVLDVGCGIGDPALPIALAVAPEGSVLAIDVSDQMVAATRRRAEALGLTNLSFRTAAAEQLDGQDTGFDAVTMRFSIFFVPDVQESLRHVRMLLRPGGSIALSVWTPHDVNPMFAIPCHELAKVVDLPAPPPDAPGPMRLARDSELADALSAAGFGDVQVEKVKTYMFARSPEEYWEMVTAMAPGLRRQLPQLSKDQAAAFRAGLIEAVRPYVSGSVVRVPALAQVGTATA